MKNKRIIFIIILCMAVILLSGCSGDEAPADDAGISGEEMTGEDLTDNIDNEAEIDEPADMIEPENDGGEPEVSEPEEDISKAEFDSNEYDITQIGYFVIGTPKGEAPVHNADATITLPGGGLIEAENGTRFEVESGAVLFCDEMNHPLQLSVYSAFRLLSGGEHDLIMESPNGIIITIDGIEDDGGANEAGTRISPWKIYFNPDKNAVFEFTAAGVKCVSLDSVFPMFKDERNGVILFKKCYIELPDGTIIDAPLNTTVRMDDGVFTIKIGSTASAKMTAPDGTETAIPGGTTINESEFAQPPA